MEKAMFKKFEVMATSMEEAKDQVKEFTLLVNATQAYKKWSTENMTTEESIKEWMKNYLHDKKFDKPGLGAYIVLQSPILDKRERPYKVNKIKYDVRTHTPKSVYMVRNNETNEEVARAEKASDAIALAKEYVTEFRENVNITRETVYKEDNALYATVEYTPSSNTREAKILAFGYEAIDVD